MNKLRLYRVDIDYIKYLYKFDNRVQYHFCNKHIDEILKKANITYNKRIEGNNKFMNKVCCDFRLLEEKCKNYKYVLK